VINFLFYHFGKKRSFSNKSKLLEQAELIDKMRLEQIQKDLKKLRITNKTLDEIIEKNEGKMNSIRLTKKEAKDLMFSMLSIAEEQYRKKQKLEVTS